MAQDEAIEAEGTLPGSQPGRRKAWRWLLLAGAVLGVLLALAWLARERIAESLIAGELEKRGIPATYTIESIGARRQVLGRLVIGDPARPDFTADRVEVETLTGWGLPGLGRITLVRPRLYGSWRGGKLSFGALDPLIFTDSKEPSALPDLDIAVRDGRARLEGDFGVAGFKAEGEGNLASGFAGTLAAVAPAAEAGGCRLAGASAYGKVSTRSGKLHFAGPLRLGALDCAGQSVRLGRSGMAADVTLDPHFDGIEGRGSLALESLAQGGNRLAALGGDLRFTLRNRAVTLQYDLAGRRAESGVAAASALALSGIVRGETDLTRIEVDGEASGSGLAAGSALEAALAQAERAGAGSLAAPIARQLRESLRREARGSRFATQYLVRRTDSITSLVVPQGRVTGGSGAALLTLSRLQATFGGAQAARVSGAFSTGGAGLPRMTGRIERAGGGQLAARLAMAEYRAGTARIALPLLAVTRSAAGAIGFAGEARLSGDLPGGRASNLVLPLDGNWSAQGGLALWRRCLPVRFDSLALASLTLDRRALTLCPPPGGAIVRAGSGGTRIAAGASAVALSGRLAGTPLRLASGPVGFAWPGTLSARAIDVALGPPQTASRFAVTSLTARLGKDLTGRFSGADVALAAVPLDMRDAAGEWRYADGRLAISGGAFRLEDRELDDRFQPLVARDAVLSLADGVIVARAVLREPASDREIVAADVVHTLSRGAGEARLAVAGVRFDKDLQPDTLSRLALGVIANAQGQVHGAGEVRWTPDRVESTGSFTADSLDFAAAFGPVEGLSGTVVFTDLLGLVTAPDQQLRIASINPGIPAENGTLSFALLPGHVLAVNGAHWPFLDGRLSLEPTRMVLGAAETRRYTLAIEGLDAAKFVAHLQLSNLAATGRFDGRLPLVFDENGGRIEEGLLISRPPGGNVSYLGELSYKDLSAMGNFAFDALRSVDYRHMRIEMNGALTGEIITRVSFDGLSQGAGSRRNFLTRQVARLPIRFNLNLRAPFFSLFGSFKSLYDPALVADPAMIGLLDRPGGVKPPVSETTP